MDVVDNVRTNVTKELPLLLKRPMPTPVRSNYLGGISAGKWHLVKDRNDHKALCGREHTSIGPFSCGMAPNETRRPGR